MPPRIREDCVVVVGGPGSGEVCGWSAESTDVFDNSNGDDDDIVGGGRRPLSQHSRNDESQ